MEKECSYSKAKLILCYIPSVAQKSCHILVCFIFALQLFNTGPPTPGIYNCLSFFFYNVWFYVTTYFLTLYLNLSPETFFLEPTHLSSPSWTRFCKPTVPSQNFLSLLMLLFPHFSKCTPKLVPKRSSVRVLAYLKIFFCFHYGGKFE